ncbi:MAG: tRNA (adenine-N1)-methyltransferase [Candidatus Caldarchaeum sp.]
MAEDENVIKEADRVLIVTEKKKRYLIQIRSGKKFHCSEGFIDTSILVGKAYGCSIVSNIGSRWNIFKPTILDRVLFFPRTTQIVYPKDLGYIVVASGIGPGSRVLEAGTGTGVLTTMLAYLVRPTGKVYSYDVKADYLEAVSVRLRQLGLSEYVELKQGDVSHGVEEKTLDSAIIDVPEPWAAVEACREALRPSGVWVSLSPTVEQVVQTFEALEKAGFGDLSCVEILMRNIRIKRGMTRPEFLMRGHTAYIVTARKTVED